MTLSQKHTMLILKHNSTFKILDIEKKNTYQHPPSVPTHPKLHLYFFTQYSKSNRGQS